MLSKTSRVISSKARNLAECPGRIPARDPSALRFVGMTTDAKPRAKISLLSLC